MRRTHVVPAVACALALTGCTTSAPPDPAPTSTPATPAPTETGEPPARTPTGTPRDVTTGLDSPWDVVFVQGAALISERDTGRILELGDDGTTRDVGAVPGVVHAGEGGLLGLAVDGRDRLYVYSTAQDGNRIQRFTLTGEPGSFALGEAETILDGLPSAGNHNGGRIAFGPDGLLYAGVGDAGERDRAQDPSSLAGKILRMTPDGEIPTDNPDPDSLVYSSGHRNVQGLAWAADGTMFASEFGQDTWDELNVIVPGGNYGWPVVEGAGGSGDFINPVQQWNPDDASPSGIAVVGGTVFVANLRGEVLRSVPVAAPGTSTAHYSGAYGRLRAVVPAPDGTLWVLTNNTDGRGIPRDGDDRLVSVDLAP